MDWNSPDLVGHSGRGRVDPIAIERLPAVMARTGLSRSSIYAAIAAGTFCEPVKLSRRAVGFMSAEVDQWIKTRERSGVATQSKRMVRG